MTNHRAVETRLAQLTLFLLALFVPIETYASWQMLGGPSALVHPGYLGSAAGFVLVFVGARRSLRARPRRAPAVMCASHAWWAGVGWHAASIRYIVLQEGNRLFFGSPEMWFVALGAALVLAVFLTSLYLTYHAERQA